MSLPITHPEMVLFPDCGIAKGELCRYYEEVASVMLPHLAGRPVTLERFPAGIAQKGFIQKDVESYMSVSAIPEGFHTITPNIIVEDAEKAIAFLRAALGAEEVARLTMPDGTIVHCELQIGDSRLNLGQRMDGWPAHGLVAQLFVANSDELFARAIAAGAQEVRLNAMAG